MKLDTAEAVKSWVNDVTRLRGFHAHEEGPSGQIERRTREAAYTETAEQLALAMRVLDIVEREADATFQGDLCGFAISILTEAKGNGK